MLDRFKYDAAERAMLKECNVSRSSIWHAENKGGFKGSIAALLKAAIYYKSEMNRLKEMLNKLTEGE